MQESKECTEEKTKLKKIMHQFRKQRKMPGVKFQFGNIFIEHRN